MISTFLFSSLLFAKDPAIPGAVTTVDEGRVNWSANRFEASQSYTERSRSWEFRENMANQAVGKTLKAAILSLPITPDNTLEEHLANDAEVSRRLLPKLEQWKTLETHYLAESHEVEVIGYLELKTLLRQLVMKEASKKIRPKEPKDHTGLLIDARDTSYSPVVLPTITNNDGEDVVSIDGFSYHTAKTRLPVLYVSDPADPRSISLIGSNPAMVRAESLTNGDLQIKTEDTSRLPSDEDLKAIVSTGKVVVVIGR